MRWSISRRFRRWGRQASDQYNGTFDLSITYLRPALGAQIFAEATVIRKGRTNAVTEVSILDEQGRLCARGRTIYAIKQVAMLVAGCQNPGTMRIEDDNGISALFRSEPVKLCGGFGFTEGPLWVASDNALIFSDIPGNRILRWRPGQTEAEVYREPSGWSNGLTMDAEGNVIACEHGGRRVSKGPYGSPGDTVAIATAWENTPFNSPNDLVVHSSGSVFFTDPNYGVDSGRRVPSFGYPGQKQDLAFQGVYRVDPDGTLSLIAPEGFTGPNGLAFSPDESVLYIGDSAERQIWRFEMNADLTLGNKTLFVDQKSDSRMGAPDGMKVDSEGRLWTTGAGGVSVHAADGTYLGVFECDEHAANLTFGGPDFGTLYMTTGTTVHSIETTVRGLVPGSR